MTSDTPQEKVLPLSDEELANILQEAEDWERDGFVALAANNVTKVWAGRAKRCASIFKLLLATITQARDDLAAERKRAEIADTSAETLRVCAIQGLVREEYLETTLATVTAERDAAVADNAAFLNAAKAFRQARLDCKESIHDELEEFSRLAKADHPGASLLSELSALRGRQRTEGSIEVCKSCNFATDKMPDPIGCKLPNCPIRAEQAKGAE